mgnify:CR=1 FL=1
MKISRKPLTVGAIIFAAVCLLGYVFYFSSFAKKVSASVPVFKAEKGTLTVSIIGTGAVVSSEKDDITVKKSGIVKKLYKNEDDVVKAGDLMIELKDDDIGIQIEDVNMNIKNLQRDMENRIQDKNDQMVKASIDGIITDINVDEGDLIKSSTVIANITNYSKYRLVVPVLFSQAKFIEPGQKAIITLPDYMCEVEGTVSNIANFSRPGNGGKIYGDIEIEVPNPGGIKIDSRASAAFPVSGQSIVCQEYGKLEVFKKTAVKFETTRPVSVKTIHVKENEFVRKGQLLLELNDDNFGNDMENIKSKLYKAQLQLQNLEYQRSNLKIYATINGTISKQKINIEDGVNMGQIISSLANYNLMEFSIPVDELDISKIKLGMKVDVTVDALPGKQYKGEVSKIANEGVSVNGVATYLVTVKVLDPKGLKVGMSANAQIILNQKKDVLMLRMAAVQQFNKKYYVVPKTVDGKVQDAGSPNKKMIEVEVGINNKDFIEITKGLNEGDEVLSPRPSSKSNTAGQSQQNPLNIIKK